MADPSLTGTPVAIDWGSAVNPAAQNITIPTDATAVYMLWSIWNNTNGSGLASATLNSLDPDDTHEIPVVGNAPAMGVVVWYNPSTGTQSLDIAWDVARAADGGGPAATVFYVKDGDTTEWRSVLSDHAGDASAVSVTLKTVSGDLVLKLDSKYGATPPSNTSGWTSATTSTLANASARAASITATGTTQACPSEDENFSGIVAVAIGPVPAPPDTYTTAWLTA